MSRKIMTVQFGEEAEEGVQGEEDQEAGSSEIERIVENNIIKPGAEMLQRELEELRPVSDKPTGPLLSAEQVTRIAIDFFKELGSKFVMPKRVLKEGERNYTVDIDLKGKIASVLVDRSTKEIIEYEIKEPRKEVHRGGFGEGGGGPSFSPVMIIVVIIMQVILMVVFNFLKLYVEIPFLTGPPAI